jgi:hypothetical protein
MLHGTGIGGGVDLVGICGIQYCSRDVTFMVKELDIVADLNALCRPRGHLLYPILKGCHIHG